MPARKKIDTSVRRYPAATAATRPMARKSRRQSGLYQNSMKGGIANSPARLNLLPTHETFAGEPVDDRRPRRP